VGRGRRRVSFRHLRRRQPGNFNERASFGAVAAASRQMVGGGPPKKTASFPSEASHSDLPQLFSRTTSSSQRFHWGKMSTRSSNTGQEGAEPKTPIAGYHHLDSHVSFSFSFLPLSLFSLFLYLSYPATYAQPPRRWSRQSPAGRGVQR